MAELAGYAYCSRTEVQYTPPGSPNSWQAQVHVHAVSNDGSVAYLGVALYKASYVDAEGITYGYRPEPDIDNPAYEGYYDLNPPSLRHIRLPPEQPRAYRYASNASGSFLLSGEPYDISELSGIDPDTEYMVWCYWEQPDEWGSFPSPARAAFIVPITPALWHGMYVEQEWHRFAIGSDAGGQLPTFWTDLVGVFEVL